MCQSMGNESRCLKSVPMLETSSSEQDRSLEVLRAMLKMGIGLMIIKLKRYNEIGGLLIGNRTTGSQAQVSYQDGVWEAPVTMVAVRMGVKELGMQTGHRGTYKWPPSQD